MRVALRTKLLIGFTLVIVLFGTVGSESWRSTRRLVADAAAVKNAQAVLTHLEALMATLTDAETGQRGFLITGDESFLAPYEAALARMGGETGALQRLMDNPEQQRRLAELERLVAARLDHLRTGVELRRNQGFEAARTHVALGVGKYLRDQVRAVIAEMKEVELASLRERERRTAVTARRNHVVVVAGGALTLALVVAAGVVIFRGFAAQRRADAQLHAANDALRAATEKAQAADRLKSAFLATMSHELRTPLNSIIGFTGILLQELAGALNAEQRKQLGMVQGSARHLLALINDVLDLSKIEAGELKVASEPFDLRASIEKAAATVRPLAEKKGLALRVEIAPEIAGAVSDPRRVEQILLNLLTNAIKFTDRGAVVLAARSAGGLAHVSVRDTGIGIKPADMATLFQPFQQINPGLARVQEGTGLGLAICRRLAGLLGGEIRVESEPGQGSTFTFSLPIRSDGQTKAGPEIQSAQRLG